ncbi:MAG: helix-turn-helix domain-containing protein [Bdellovibrionales bacterium]|nr:helix-turn-helix domain-containing protein [Bdellovibrionales bacterium]
MRHAKRRMGKEAFSKVGDFFKDKRVEVNLTQSEVAEALGLSSGQFVSNWERGVSMPPMDYLPKLVKLYKINKSELVSVYTSEQERFIKEVLYR